MPEEFVPTEGGKDCDKYPGGWGVAMNDYEFIWYNNTNQKKYPPEACPPYYHTAAKIDLFKVNTEINGAGSIAMDGSITMGGSISGGGHVLSNKKNFDIPHPNKSGWRLRHTCLEGPENAVYFRGRLKDNNIIDLPKYWIGFVDPETITVTLTQIGSSQDLIVEEVEWGTRIVIKSGNASAIDCYFLVHGERLDGDRLIAEYEGQSTDDYPGDNKEYNVNT